MYVRYAPPEVSGTPSGTMVRINSAHSFIPLQKFPEQISDATVETQALQTPNFDVLGTLEQTLLYSLNFKGMVADEHT
jgi:hypothetical protein